MTDKPETTYIPQAPAYAARLSNDEMVRELKEIAAMLRAGKCPDSAAVADEAARRFAKVFDDR